MKHREITMRHHFVSFAVLFLAALPALAQQERPENNFDLRGGKPLILMEKGDERWELERNVNGDFQLVQSQKGEASKHKLARAKAEDIDQRFSAAFLQVQYELPADPKDCTTDWRMVLRGEEYRFCSKNEQKDRVASSLVDELRGLTRP